jgi:hypothetical protein
MTIYDRRDQPAYRDYNWPPYSNPNIDRWWTVEHDEFVERLIEQWQWYWYWALVEAAIAKTPPFRKDILDPYIEQEKHYEGAWYNNVMKFGIDRVKELGLTSQIRNPQWKTCPLCGEKFVESSLPYPLAKRLGMDHLDFCAPCLKNTILQGTGNSTLSREQVLEFVRGLTDVLQQIPHQGFGEGAHDFHDMDFEHRLAVLKMLQSKPTASRVKELFGSWLQALIEAGVLDEDARRTSRGIQSLAKDGHICLSLGEKTIDDFLNTYDIAHDREPKYPNSNYRADFAVGSVLIEYFGLEGDPDYDEKTKEKQRICKKHGINLITIYPRDLANITKLEGKLRKFFPLANATVAKT